MSFRKNCHLLLISAGLTLATASFNAYAAPYNKRSVEREKPKGEARRPSPRGANKPPSKGFRRDAYKKPKEKDNIRDRLRRRSSTDSRRGRGSNYDRGNRGRDRDRGRSRSRSRGSQGGSGPDNERFGSTEKGKVRFVLVNDPTKDQEQSKKRGKLLDLSPDQPQEEAKNSKFENSPSRLNQKQNSRADRGGNREALKNRLRQ